MNSPDKKILFFEVVVLGLVLLVLLDFSQKPKEYGNIGGLYSSFTNYMAANVESGLSYLNCNPEGYSDNGEEICFFCDKNNVCFGYDWVSRTGGLKRNSKSPFYLEGVGELKTSFVDFCYEGLASDLGCESGERYNELECEDILFINKSQGNRVDCDKIIIEKKGGGDFSNFANNFCNIKEEEIIKITNNYAICGKVEGCEENSRDSPCAEGELCNDAPPLSLCGKYIITIQDGEIILFEK